MRIHLHVEVGTQSGTIIGTFTGEQYNERVAQHLIQRVVPVESRHRAELIENELNKTIDGLSGLFTSLSIVINGVKVMEKPCLPTFKN